MKTIPEILDLAMSSVDNLPTAMLHCKVLADGLGHVPFKEWVTRELNGYEDRASVPYYRLIRGKLGGTFERYFVSSTYDHVPPHVLGPQMMSLVETIHLQHPLGALSTLPDDGRVNFQVLLEQDILNIVNTQFGTRGRFVTIWLTIAPGSLAPVLITIQHRLVSFLSELNQLFPTPADAVNPTPEKQAEMDAPFERHLSIGHVDNVIISPRQVFVDQSSNVFQQINVGNWSELDEFLGKQNIPSSKREEAKKILDKAASGDNSKSTQKELSDWIEDTASDMASGVGEVLREATKKAATDTIIDGLKRYAPAIAQWASIVAMRLIN